MTDKLTQTAYENIYLCICDDDEDGVSLSLDIDFKEFEGDATWCESRVSELSVEYIRADLVEAALVKKLERIRALKTSDLNMVIGVHMLNAVLAILEDKV
jgi:hypothetical protein